jgi:hypothetical protein
VGRGEGTMRVQLFEVSSMEGGRGRASGGTTCGGISLEGEGLEYNLADVAGRRGAG